jgi:hypothetical protein
VRLLIRVLLAVACSGCLLAAFAQNSTFRSGFGVVTPFAGNVSALIATETLRNESGTGISQAIVAPSVLLTSVSVLVPVGPMTGNTTAIAIANPSMGSGSVNLVLTNASGAIVLNSTIVLGPRGQFSRFLNEFFPAQPDQFSTPLLLTMSSEIPVALVAFNFRGNDFTWIPLTSLSFPTPVPVQQPTTSLTPSVPSPPFGPGGMPVPIVTFSPPIIPTGPPAQTTASIGGGPSLVFPQVVTGGGWSTEMAVGNTSTASLSIRIDFFDPNGKAVSSFTNVSVPPLGVVFLSTDLSGTSQ